MVEYKELERALLARMFRKGLISSSIFLSRVQDLGYSPSDAALMLNLEAKEGARVVVWEGALYDRPVLLRPGAAEKREAPAVDMVKGTYGYLTFDGVADPDIAHHRVEFIQTTADMKTIGSMLVDLIAPPFPATGSYVESIVFTLEPGVVKARLIHEITLGGAVNKEVTPPIIKVEVVTV